ncbi:MAG TPA: hypothetical protein VH309_05480, partial [Elusimicrobiota bacterium]|nr:hypothetical protein [Elusimicrobiota bacterium]
MNPPIRALLVALLLLPARVCVGDDPAPTPDDASVAAAQNLAVGVDQGLHGVVGNLTAGKISEIYGERQVGDPGAAADGPSGTGATSNAAAALPDAQLPQGFKREA